MVMSSSKQTLAIETAVIILVLTVGIGWWYLSTQNSRGTSLPVPAAAIPSATITTKPVTTSTTTTTPAAPDPTLAGEKKGPATLAAADVDVTTCKPQPAQATVKLGSSLIFRNKDAKAHTISFTPKIAFVIPAQSVKQVKFDFDGVPGSRKYRCDGVVAGTIVETL
jgi:plastocyanin